MTKNELLKLRLKCYVHETDRVYNLREALRDLTENHDAFDALIDTLLNTYKNAVKTLVELEQDHGWSEDEVEDFIDECSTGVELGLAEDIGNAIDRTDFGVDDETTVNSTGDGVS